jgi:hypothetical protein
VTDEDRQLLLDLRRMTEACCAFCAGVLENDLSRDDQFALSARLADMAERIRERALRTPVVIEGEAVTQEAISPASSTGGTV